MSQPDIAVVGAGIFGVTAALELRARGHSVHLLDPGPLPHPLAESTDISKAVRMEYGADEDYMRLLEECLPLWRAWNAEFEQELFHETGVLFCKTRPMQPGDFEYESYRLLLAHGHHPDRITPQVLRERFPAWNSQFFVDGFFHAQGGFAESGNLVSRLLAKAARAGVTLREGVRALRLLEQDGHVVGVESDSGEKVAAGQVVVAAGAWTPYLLPHLRDFFHTAGQPVFHLRPGDPSLFQPNLFPVFGGDVSSTGYYGFPLSSTGVVKIANHGPGREMHPDSPARAVGEPEIADLRAFLSRAFPALAAAPIVYTRLCLYCDTWDEHFWIARDPQKQGLVVATGGSGHAFKFAPLVGRWIADAVEARPNPTLAKFRWRPEVRPGRGEEAARHHA